MAMLSGSLSPMKFNIRADLFAQLGAMEEAGLPFDTVLDSVHLPANEGARLKATRKWIRVGLGIAEAGLRSGLFTPLEASLVRTATLSGSPARTYRLIADQCARRAARIKAIKSRMTFPAAMVAVWIILGPVPNLVTGSLTLSSYLVKHLLPWIGAGANPVRVHSGECGSTESYRLCRCSARWRCGATFGTSLTVWRCCWTRACRYWKPYPWRWTRFETKHSNLNLLRSNRGSKRERLSGRRWQGCL